MTVIVIALFIFLVSYAIVCVFGDGHDFKIVKETVPFSNPPRIRFSAYGKWPNNLICYGVFSSEEDAQAWALKAGSP